MLNKIAGEKAGLQALAFQAHAAPASLLEQCFEGALAARVPVRKGWDRFREHGSKALEAGESPPMCGLLLSSRSGSEPCKAFRHAFCTHCLRGTENMSVPIDTTNFYTVTNLECDQMQSICKERARESSAHSLLLLVSRRLGSSP